MNKTKKIINGIEVNYLPAEKYKHQMIVVSFISRANPKTYNERNIVLNILENHNRIYKTDDQFYWQLNMLYGASFRSDVSVIGDKVSSNFYMKIINDKYLDKEESLIEQAFDFLHNVIYKPKLYKSLITKKAVEESLKELEELFSSIQQDKATKAFYNFVELMSDSNYPVLFPSKTYFDLINQETISNEYLKMVKDDYIKIFVAGDFDHNRVDQLIESKFKNYHGRNNLNTYTLSRDTEIPKTVTVINEFDEVSVARINLGYRINVELDSHDYETVQLLNVIIGGYSQSKLFLEIREKQQLVYSIYSSYAHDLSLLYITLETEFKEKDIAIKETQTVIKDIQKGNISQEIIDQAKAYFIKVFRSSMDKLNGLLVLNMNSDFKTNHFFDLDKQINKISLITKEDLIRVSNNLSLDTIYCFTKEGDPIE